MDEALHFFAELGSIWGSCHCRPSGSSGGESRKEGREPASWLAGVFPPSATRFCGRPPTALCDSMLGTRSDSRVQLPDRPLTVSSVRDPHLCWRPVPRSQVSWQSLPPLVRVTRRGPQLRPASGRAPPSGFPSSFLVRPPSLSRPRGAEAFALEVGILLPPSLLLALLRNEVRMASPKL